MSEAISGSSGAAGIDRTYLSWGAGALAAALVADVLFNVHVDAGESGGTGPMLIVGAILVVVAAVVFLGILPRVRDASRGALIFGVVTVLSLAAFWSGGPLLLAGATFALLRRAPQATPARIGAGLAAIAAVLDVVAAFSNL
jgi:hypothetical protein